MTTSTRRLITNLLNDLKQERDELALQIHLGKQEAKDEWRRLEDKLNDLNDRFGPTRDAVEESGEEIWNAVRQVGDEVKLGFDRIRKSL